MGVPPNHPFEKRIFQIRTIKTHQFPMGFWWWKTHGRGIKKKTAPVPRFHGSVGPDALHQDHLEISRKSSYNKDVIGIQWGYVCVHTAYIYIPDNCLGYIIYIWLYMYIIPHFLGYVYIYNYIWLVVSKPSWQANQKWMFHGIELDI